MKAIQTCLLISLCFVLSEGFAQSSLFFHYDAAGNQVLRDIACINCGGVIEDNLHTNAIQSVDENNLKSATGKKIIGDTLFASPNPVTNKLRVQWIHEKENPLLSLQLHNAEGQLIYQQSIRNDAGQIEINFSMYPPGFYYLIGTTANRSKKTIKVVRL